MYPSYEMLQHRGKLLEDIVKKKRKVKEVAEILDVKRETVSRWLGRYRFGGMDEIIPAKPGPKKGSLAVNRTPEEIEELVCEKAKWNSFKGPQTLADLLQEEDGITLHPVTLYRILKRKSVRYGPSYRKLKKKRKAYSLNQPGDELQLDVCFPFGYARKECVYDSVDDCSRFAFAELKSAHNQASAMSFVDSIVKAFPFTIKAIRTDCGHEFSTQFTEHLKELGIEHRKNAPYTPQHNGKVERYHRTFKELEAYSWPFSATKDELNYRLKLWLQEYNFHRKHRGLAMNGLTPAQKLLYASFQLPLYPHLQSVTGTLQLNIY